MAMLTVAERVGSRAAQLVCAFASVLGLVNAVGCTSNVPYATDADVGSTHAFVSIQRSQTGDAEHAGALAGFARMPASVDSAAVLALVGWSLDLPPPGQCAAHSTVRDPKTPLSPIDHIEFLDAGEVTLQTAGVGTTLAPHAFPTVTDLISGVVYATRDRSSATLPAGTRYSVRTSGGVGLVPLSVISDAPGTLEVVSVGGKSMKELVTIAVNRPLELVWKAGIPGDWLVVEVTDVGTNSGIWCAYRDEEGSATIPTGTIGTRGNGKFGLHRVRSQPIEAPGLSRGELRFDFEVTAAVTFAESAQANSMY